MASGAPKRRNGAGSRQKPIDFEGSGVANFFPEWAPAQGSRLVGGLSGLDRRQVRLRGGELFCRKK